MSDIQWVFRSAALDADAGVRHGFFTRLGGVSEGPFASLNCGFGSGDSPQRVMRNRTVAMDCLGLPADRLVTARQIHSAAVATVERPWRREEGPRAGIATVEVMPPDPVAEEAHFFSYRRSCLRGERFFGLGLSAVVLEE